MPRSSLRQRRSRFRRRATPRLASPTLRFDVGHPCRATFSGGVLATAHRPVVLQETLGACRPSWMVVRRGDVPLHCLLHWIAAPPAGVGASVLGTANRSCVQPVATLRFRVAVIRAQPHTATPPFFLAPWIYRVVAQPFFTFVCVNHGLGSPSLRDVFSCEWQPGTESTARCRRPCVPP